MVRLSRSRALAANNQGQATVEYILLISIVLMIFLGLSEGLTQGQLMQKILAPINTDYRQAYQNGHYKALAPDDQGGPFKHPRAIPGAESFRIFYSRGPT